MGAIDAALEVLEEHFEREIERLCALAQIPSVSGVDAHTGDVQRCAEAVADQMREAGLAVEFIEVAGAPPYVLGRWLDAGREAPTILFYAHYDVQPPGSPAEWKTPAFEPQRRDDGRLYGRGVADDKAGIVLVLAALRAWLAANAELPVNIKFLVEGEEGFDVALEAIA